MATYDVSTTHIRTSLRRLTRLNASLAATRDLMGRYFGKEDGSAKKADLANEAKLVSLMLVESQLLLSAITAEQRVAVG